MASRKRRLALLAVAALSAALLVVWHRPIERAAVAAVFDAVTGDRVAFDVLRLRAGEVVVGGLRVRRGGDPLLEVARLDIRYRAGELLPGSGHRFGLRGIDARGVRLSIVRRSDGTFNAGATAAPSGGGTTSASASSPLAFQLRVAGGEVRIIDPWRRIPESRRLSLDHLELDASIDTAARTTYRLLGRVDDDPAAAFAAAGTIDTPGRYAIHHLTARSVPIAAPLNYVIDRSSAEVLAGVVRDLDVRAYAFGDGRYHLAGGARLQGGAMRVPGIVPAIRGMEGALGLFDGGVATTLLTARVGAIPARVSGALYGWRAPWFRLGIVARTSVTAARSLFTFSRRLPLSGTTLTVATLLEGAVGTPLVAVRFAAPRARYGAVPLTAVSGDLAYYESGLAFARSAAKYGRIAVGMRGALDIAEHDTPELAVELRAPAGSLPFIAQAAPSLPAQAVALLSGSNLALDGRGVVSGANAVARLGGLFRVDRLGDGEFGPFHLENGRGKAEGAYYFDRSHSASGFWLRVSGLAVRRLTANPRLPALEWLAPPDFDATVAGTVAGEGPPNHFRFAGSLALAGLDVGNVARTDLRAQVAGALADARLGNLVAHGPWGAFHGIGAYAGGRLTLKGAYRGSFEGLASLTGSLHATGPLEGPVALAITAGHTLVQTSGVATSGAAVRGIPVDRIAGTLGLDGANVDVYAARASVAGGELALSGRIGPGDGDRVGVSVAGARPGLLRGNGASLPSGTLAMVGAFRYRGATPQFDGGMALTGARYRNVPLAGNGTVHLRAGTLELADTLALFGHSGGTVGGRVSGLGSGALDLDVGVRMRDVALGPALTDFHEARVRADGTLNADLRVTGKLAHLALGGGLRVPEGSFDGLRFAALGARLRARADSVSLNEGGFVVGSTATRFSASAGGGSTSLFLSAPAADLSDFDDLFDAGEALAGRGHLAASFARRGGALQTAADVAFSGVRYRNFTLGQATARWETTGSHVAGAIGLGGGLGRLDGRASIAFASGTEPLRALLARSQVDGRLALSGLDLGAWLPALGIDYPVAGRLDASALIAGRVESPAIAVAASLARGRIGGLPIDRLTLAARTEAGRLQLTDAQLQLPGLSATASGTLGLRANDPLGIAVMAQSADVGLLERRMFPGAPPVTGTATVTARVTGVRFKPRFTGRFDLRDGSIRGVGVRQLGGLFSVRGRDLTVSGAQIALNKGTLALAGALPIVLDPLGIGPSSAPLDLVFTADAVDLADFAPLLPAGSRLGGALDGRLAVRGSVIDPELVGRMAVRSGLYGAAFDAVPLTDLSLGVSFLGNEATLDDLKATAGGGHLAARGHVQLVDLIRPQADARYGLEATASNLYFDVPALGRGTVDGKLTVAHDPGKMPRLSASATLADATIPFSAFLFAAANDPAAGPAAPDAAAKAARDVALNLHLVADRNVRIRSANVDIGGRGSLNVSGTYQAPVLSGEFDSTGGTLTYFNTVFRVQQGTVVFAPADGIIPNLDALATTHVVDPDPVAARNLTGSADIDLAMTGPVTNLNIALSSNPSYDREQILGLLLNAPAVGATNLFSGTTLVPGQLSQPALPPGVAVTRPGTGEITVGQEAFGLANAQFTRALLAPVESQISEALGLTNLAVNVDYTGEVGVTARKVLGKTVDAIYGQSFAYPYRQTFGFEIKPSRTMAAQLTYFQTLGVQALGTQSPLIFGETANQRLNAQPLAGQSGFSFSLQRLLP